MSVEEDLVTHLNTIGALTTYVGARIATDENEEDEAYPRLTIHTIAGGEEHHLTGGAGFARPRLQLSIWSTGRTNANAIREVLRNRLQGFTGTWGTTTRVNGVQFESGPYLVEKPEAGQGKSVYHQPIDLIVYYQQPGPTNPST